MIPRVATWFRDAAVRNVMKRGLTVFAGRSVGQLASLVSVAVLTRRLGPEQFGVLALIRTVAGLTEAYANFNTWQAVLKYGAAAVVAGKRDDVRRILKLAMLIDVSTAMLAAVVIVALACVIPSLFGFSTHESLLCALYALTVLTRVAGTCDGIYRICNAYRSQAIGDAFQAAAPAVAVVIAGLCHAGLEGMVVALVCGEIAGNLVDMTIAFLVASQHGYGGWPRISLVDARVRFPGILHFIFASSGQLTVKKTQNEFDMIVVGSMLGQFASGLFKLVKQLGRIPALAFMPLEQVLFADLAHHAAAHDYQGFQRLLRRFTGIVFLGALGAWAVVALTAHPLVQALAGEKFLDAVPALRIYLLAMAITVANAPAQRALIVLGRPGTVLVFDLGTLGVLVATTIMGAYVWGITGVAGAFLLHKLTQLTWSSILVTRVIRQKANEG